MPELEHRTVNLREEAESNSYMGLRFDLFRSQTVDYATGKMTGRKWALNISRRTMTGSGREGKAQLIVGPVIAAETDTPPEALLEVVVDLFKQGDVKWER